MKVMFLWVSAGLLALVFGSPYASIRHVGPRHGRTEVNMNARDRNIEVMRRIFQAIEERTPNAESAQRELALVQPDVEFHWPACLPYGGTFQGLGQRRGPTWGDVWTPLQPSMAERRMNPRVLGADDREVAILYHQRGVSPTGELFDGEVIGLYELRDFKLSRAQMFYFDEAAACRFLAHAASPRRE